MGEAGILTEDDRVELLDGELIEMPPISDRHAGSVDYFTETLPLALQRRANVRIQNPVRLDDGSEPLPDAMLLRRRDDFYRSRKPSPADVLLLIEVSDTSLDYDRGAFA